MSSLCFFPPPPLPPPFLVWLLLTSEVEGCTCFVALLTRRVLLGHVIFNSRSPNIGPLRMYQINAKMDRGGTVS